MIPCEYPDKLYLSETRMIVLPDAVNHNDRIFICLDKTSECDGQTDRIGLAITAVTRCKKTKYKQMNTNESMYSEMVCSPVNIEQF